MTAVPTKRNNMGVAVVALSYFCLALKPRKRKRPTIKPSRLKRSSGFADTQKQNMDSDPESGDNLEELAQEVLQQPSKF